MFGRSDRRNRHRGCRGGGLPSFFEGRSSLLDRSRPLRPILLVRLLQMRRSILTMKYLERLRIMQWRPKRRIMFRLAIPYDICSYQTSGGWMERVWLGALGLQPVEPCLQTLTCDITMRTRYLVFPEEIFKMRVFLPLHPFVVQVLDYFDIIPFQLPPNSHCLIVAFYIISSEYCSFMPSVVHFEFIYGLKALAKHTGFWYLTSRGDSARIVGLPSNTSWWKYNFFFYPSAIESSK